MARAMLLLAKMPARFWGEAVTTAGYMRNRMAIGPGGKSPEEVFTGRKSSVIHLRTFGCIAFADIASVNRAKLDPVSRKTVLIGYLPASRQYKLYDPIKKQVLISSNPKFEEDQFWDWSAENEEPGEEVELFDPMEPVLYEAMEAVGYLLNSYRVVRSGRLQVPRQRR